MQEILEIICLPSISLLSLEDFPDIPEVEEKGSSFADNALAKAQAAAYHTGLPSLADDSGLEVEALGGRPGVLSARYAGPGSDDSRNIAKLLSELTKVPPEKRKACFVCRLTLVHGGRAYMAEGRLQGLIVDRPRGTHGFGYDPVFLVPEMGLTLAELEPSQKNLISHRSQALRKILPIIRHLAGLKKP